MPCAWLTYYKQVGHTVVDCYALKMGFNGSIVAPQAIEEAITSIGTDEGSGPVLSLSAFKQLLGDKGDDLGVFACRTVDNI